MRERLAKSTPGPGTPLSVPSPIWGDTRAVPGALGHTHCRQPAPPCPEEPPGSGWLLTNASFSPSPTLGTVPLGLPAALCWGTGRKGPLFCLQQGALRADALGTQTWRWTSSGISGPDFAPGVQLACPQPTEPEQELSLGGLRAFLGAPNSSLST